MGHLKNTYIASGNYNTLWLINDYEGLRFMSGADPVTCDESDDNESQQWYMSNSSTANEENLAGWCDKMVMTLYVITNSANLVKASVFINGSQTSEQTISGTGLLYLTWNIAKKLSAFETECRLCFRSPTTDSGTFDFVCSMAFLEIYGYYKAHPFIA